MPSPESQYAFADYPRRRLSPRVDRRTLFSGFATELKVSEGRGRGGIAYRLSDLGVATDDELASVRPRLVEGHVLLERDGVMWAIHTARDHRIKLCPADHAAADVLRAFDGTTSLADAALGVSDRTGWQASEAFAYVRGVFLHVVTLGVGAPS